MSGIEPSILRLPLAAAAAAGGKLAIATQAQQARKTIRVFEAISLIQ
jgi:hypothetical protein